MSRFFIVNTDASGVVGKKTWDNKHDAEEHAHNVLKQTPSQQGFFICEAISAVQRRSPPIETVDLKSQNHSVFEPPAREAAE